MNFSDVKSSIVLLAIIEHVCESVKSQWKAMENMFPYQVSVRIDGEHVCGGTIIDELYILTAAHCVDDEDLEPTDMTVHAGLIQLDDEDSIQSDVNKIIIHDHYVPAIKPTQKQVEENVGGKIIYRAQNDIAILELIDGFNIDNEVRKVNLPKSPVQPGWKCDYAGWSVNEINYFPEEADFDSYNLDSDDEPKPKRRRIDGRVSNDLTWARAEVLSAEACAAKATPMRDDEFCVDGFDLEDGTSSKGMVTCPGDSGGPFVCNDVVYGIAVTSRCNIYLPSTFVDVHKHLDDFIRKEVSCI